MDVASLTDAELLELFIGRRAEEAFEAVVRRHGPMVLGVCRRVLQNEADAADAFQATFLVLVRRANCVAPRDQLGHWLYGVAYRTALNTRGSRDRRRSREQPMAQVPEPAAEQIDPNQELRKRLDLELSRLPAKYRVPLILCELEGQSYKDAAKQLGLTVSALSVRLVRGRTMLAGRLARHGAEVLLGAVTVLLSQSRAAAEVPGWLTDSTVMAAGQLAAGTAAAGAIAPQVAAITEGVLKSMALAKTKSLVIAAVVVLMIGLPAGVMIHRATRSGGEKEDAPNEAANTVSTVIGTSAGKGVKNASANSPQEIQAKGNMQNFGLTMHNYYELKGSFPPAVGFGPDGKTPHSWRVALLEMIDPALYRQYDLNQPWDSDTNRKVLAKMPAIYRDPGEPAGSTNAAYFVLTGPQAAFSDQANEVTKIVQFTDGPSNTILIVEAKRDIPWTKPEDIRYVAEQPLPKFGGYRPDGFLAVFADGGVNPIGNGVSETALRSMITKAGNEPPDQYR